MFRNNVKDLDKKERNKNEWERLNINWKQIKTENKKQNPELYTSADSDSESDDNVDSENNTNLVINIKSDSDEPVSENNSKILKRCGSSYDELLTSQDCIITEKNEIKCDTPIFHDGVEDSKTHFTSSSSSSSSHSMSSHNYFDDNDNENDNEYFIDTEMASKVTIDSIRNKYNIENAASLVVDYSINYNMKALTHLGNYYNIIANNTANKSFFDNLNDANPKPKSKSKSTSAPKKMLKSELIKNIVLFETNSLNYPIVLKYRKMMEKIEDLRADKYFSNFVLFP
jgi:predicted transposase YbfD/YdcC